MGSEVLVTGTRAASELDDEALAHEVGTILNQLGRMFGFLYTRSYVRNAVYRLACVQWIGAWLKLTRDNITSVWKWPSTSALVALRGRLPRYRRVDDTSVIVTAVAVELYPKDNLV